jgi:predicted DNA-binding transcriptional regulator YafY
VPERIEIAFEPRIAPYVRERLWHSSQEIRDEVDGRIVVTLNVSNDFALRSWILGFGGLAKVIGPAQLAREIQAEVARMTALYEESSEAGDQGRPGGSIATGSKNGAPEGTEEAEKTN